MLRFLSAFFILIFGLSSAESHACASKIRDEIVPLMSENIDAFTFGQFAENFHKNFKALLDEDSELQEYLSAYERERRLITGLRTQLQNLEVPAATNETRNESEIQKEKRELTRQIRQMEGVLADIQSKSIQRRAKLKRDYLDRTRSERIRHFDWLHREFFSLNETDQVQILQILRDGIESGLPEYYMEEVVMIGESIQETRARLDLRRSTWTSADSARYGRMLFVEGAIYEIIGLDYDRSYRRPGAPQYYDSPFRIP